MGHIAEEHVEWAVVNRLKAMLDDPPKTKFNVTQSFAVFSAILLWTKNRAWVGGNQKNPPDRFDKADHAARDARKRLRNDLISEEPWRLSQTVPELVVVDDPRLPNLGHEKINADFAGMSAENFFKWLRDAVAHGDGRYIKPVHKFSIYRDKIWLTGFQIEFPETKGSDRLLVLTLYHDDIRRLGATLADLFCQELSGDHHYPFKDVATRIEEVA